MWPPSWRFGWQTLPSCWISCGTTETCRRARRKPRTLWLKRCSWLSGNANFATHSQHDLLYYYARFVLILLHRHLVQCMQRELFHLMPAFLSESNEDLPGGNESNLRNKSAEQPTMCESSSLACSPSRGAFVGKNAIKSRFHFRWMLIRLAVDGGEWKWSIEMIYFLFLKYCCSKTLSLATRLKSLRLHLILDTRVPVLGLLCPAPALNSRQLVAATHPR